MVCAATSAVRAAESPWLLTAIAWALLWLIMSPQRGVGSRYFEEPLREALGDDYEAIAAQSQPARRRRRHDRRVRLTN